MKYALSLGMGDVQRNKWNMHSFVLSYHVFVLEHLCYTTFWFKEIRSRDINVCFPLTG